MVFLKDLVSLQAIITLFLAAVVAADELPMSNPPIIEILRNEQHNPDEFGNHNSDFEAANGIEVHLSGSQGENGGANVIGSWR